MMKNLTEELKIPKRLFLIDSLGAVVSAFFLGVILVRFESAFGMPVNVLYLLTFAACVFAIYSATCYLKTPANWQPFLKTIALVNLTYTCLTIGLMIHFYEKLTLLGLAYFVGELAIVITVAGIELKTAIKE